jgi:hypothetical protein
MRLITININQDPQVALQIEDLNLSTMQKLVGGYIQCLPIAPGIDLWLNEEGRLQGMAPNVVVPVPGRGDFTIVGPCFIAGNTDQGDSRGLTGPEAVKWLAAAETWVRPPAPYRITKCDDGDQIFADVATCYTVDEFFAYAAAHPVKGRGYSLLRAADGQTLAFTGQAGPKSTHRDIHPTLEEI